MIFCIRDILVLTFSLIVVLVSFIASSTPEIPFSVSYILLVILVSVVPVLLPRFYISKVSSVYGFFFLFVCFYFHFQVLNSFIYFLHSFVCSWIILRDLLISSSIIFTRLNLKSFSCVLTVLNYSRFVVA